MAFLFALYADLCWCMENQGLEQHGRAAGEVPTVRNVCQGCTNPILKGFGYVFVSNDKQEQAKAGYHHGDGILPFVLYSVFRGNRCVRFKKIALFLDFNKLCVQAFDKDLRHTGSRYPDWSTPSPRWSHRRAVRDGGLQCAPSGPLPSRPDRRRSSPCGSCG